MTLNPAIHKTILLQILVDIYSDTTIGPFMGFKGGTAAYLFYGLDRFSIDLDFDLLDPSKEAYIFEKIEQILKKYGTVKEAEKKRFNLLFILSYNQKVQNAQNIKVEINRRDFGSHHELKSYMGISMLVQTQQDMFAHKLIAMKERLGRTNRDIYDVWFFLEKNWPINTDIVEKRSRIPFKEFLEKCISALESFNIHAILDGIGELLNEKQKSWVKTKLLSETIFLLKLKRENG